MLFLRRLAVALLALSCLALPGAARADHIVRWVVLKAVVPEDGSLMIIASGVAVFDGDDVATVGTGVGVPNGGVIEAHSANEGGPFAIGVTSPFGTMRFDMSSGGGFETAFRSVGAQTPGMPVAILFYVTGGELEGTSAWASSSDGEPVPVEVETGSATGLIRWTDGTGIAAEAGVVGASALSDTQRFVDTGVAGAAIDGIGAFDFGWHAPEQGRDDRDQFAGPAGAWRWDWSGATALQRGAVASYAELGEHWTFFRPAS